MFNQEQAIANWRRRLAEGGVRSPTVLDELESHLREEIRKLVSTGTPEAEAFQLAQSRLGDTESLTTEFQKLSNRLPVRRWLPVLVGSGILLALTTILFAARLPGGPSPLLLAHTLTLTIGDVTSFFAGSLGICYVLGLRLKQLSPDGQQSLSRAAVLFNRLAACLVLAGLLLGMVWSVQNRGHYLSAAPREVGTACAAIWLFTFCLIQRFGRLGVHATMLLCVAGNFIICLAWFGAGLVSHNYSIGSSWQLNTALVINLLFLAWGLLPRFVRAETGDTYV
jgi:hypothetical protein